MITFGANHANPDNPGLEDLGEIVLRSNKGHGFFRVDGSSPDGRPVTDHLFVVDRDGVEHIDCAGANRPHDHNLADDVYERTEMAIPQGHFLKVMQSALEIQAKAVHLGLLR